MTQTKGHMRVNWHAPRATHAALKSWSIRHGLTLQDGLTTLVERSLNLAPSVTVVAPTVRHADASPFGAPREQPPSYPTEADIYRQVFDREPPEEDENAEIGAAPVSPPRKYDPVKAQSLYDEYLAKGMDPASAKAKVHRCVPWSNDWVPTDWEETGIAH